MNVLIADDDPVARQFVESSIQCLGHRVASFPDGESALNAMASFAPNVVVSDWRMPGVDGLELCRQVRARMGGCVYFILISSALGEMGNSRQVRDAGVDDVLPKPMRMDELWSKLRKVEAKAV